METETCPFCVEPIPAGSRRCPHCDQPIRSSDLGDAGEDLREEELSNEFWPAIDDEMDLGRVSLDDSDATFLPYLQGRNLRGALLSGADLFDADLAGADLRSADLAGAMLSEANLSGADLSGANLVDADLSEANLCGADLTGADLTGADLSGARYDGGTLWPEGLDFTSAGARRTSDGR